MTATAIEPAPKSRTLFDIGNEFRALNDRLDEIGGEITDPALEAEFTARFADLDEAEGVKLDRYVAWIRTLEMEVSAARSEAEEYALRARSRENRIKWLKQQMKDYLIYTNREKALTATGRTIAIQANGGAIPLKLAENIDPATIPDDLAVVKRSVDVEAVRKALMEGREVAFASLGVKGTHLRIR